MSETARTETTAGLLALVHATLDEIDRDSGAPAAVRSADEVLAGDGGLSSLAFVTFAIALEERLAAAGWSVAVMDLLAGAEGPVTAGDLAARLAVAVAVAVGDGA